MRLQNAQVRTTLSLTGLVAATLVVAGCAAEPIPPSFAANPTVTAVYAIDAANANSPYTFDIALADVLLWSSAASDAGRTSPMPPSYGGLRIEFDQPMKGETFANEPDRSGASFCSPISAGAIKLTDPNDGDRTLAASICYDSASPLGSNPNVKIVIGLGTGLVSTPEDPFTCQEFFPEDYETDPTNVLALKAEQTYTVKFDTTKITSTTGGALKLPTGSNSDGAGWTSVFTFKTAGFAIMAAGFQDPNTGYFAFLKKPFKGYLKDMDEGKLYPTLDPFTVPADDSPFFIITTYGIALGANDQPVGATGDAVTATRSDGSAFDARIFVDWNFGAYSYDPRIIYVAPGGSLQFLLPGSVNGSGRWEPGQKYKITVKGNMQNGEGSKDLGGTDAVYEFSAAAGSPGIAHVTPTNGSIAQVPYGANLVLTPGSSNIVIELTHPADSSTVTTDNVKLLDSAGAVVPASVTLTTTRDNVADGYGYQLGKKVAQNEQVIDLRPTNPLPPNKSFKVSVSGLKTKASLPNGQGGLSFPAFTSTFQTATFRVDSIRRSCQQFPNNRECSNIGSVVSFDRGVNVGLAAMRTNTLQIRLTRPASAITPDQYQVTEIKADGSRGTTLASTQYAMNKASTAPSGIRYTLNVTDPTYPVKCNQKYELKGLTTITDTDSPANNFSAESCKDSAGCPDIKTFITAALAPLPIDTSGHLISFSEHTASTPDTFTVTFNATLDKASANAAIQAGAFKLYGFDASGGRVALPVTCPDLADDEQYKIVCTANSTLDANKSYLASFVVPTTSGIKIAASTKVTGLSSSSYGAKGSTVFVGDQTTCVFSGSINQSITTSCP